MKPMITDIDTEKRLRRLRDDGFIQEWGTQGRKFLIVAGGTFGPYTRREANAWLDGCEAMGAATR